MYERKEWERGKRKGCSHQAIVLGADKKYQVLGFWKVAFSSQRNLRGSDVHPSPTLPSQSFKFVNVGFGACGR